MDRSLKTKKDEFEINFYKGIIEKSPRFVEALAALGDLYTKIGYYQEGMEMDMRLVAIKPHDPVVLYNLACSYSLMSKIDLAFVTIKRAIKNGYDDFSYIEKDKDLENLHKDERFRRYFVRLQQNMSQKHV